MSKRLIIGVLVFFNVLILNAQSVAINIDAAIKKMEQLPLLKGATYSLYVVDANTQKVVFAKNELIGLATASCLKTLTTITALDLLGPNFTYKTVFSLLPNNTITVMPTGDPSLGSWRYKITKPDTIINSLIKAFGLGKTVAYKINVNDNYLGSDKIGGATIWEDIGSYYGTTCSAFNWYENQTDAVFKTGEVGTKTTFVQTKPLCSALQLVNETTSGAKTTGDYSLTYYLPNSTKRIITGTLENDKNLAAVGLAVPSPVLFFGDFIQSFLPKTTVDENLFLKAEKPLKTFTHTSPELSKLVYWFNKKSINLYGDALLRTMGKKLNTDGSYEKSTEALVKYWADKNIGIESYELKLFDGSGLSPQTRVTTKALVTAIQYAYKQPWFNSFYDALPEYNGMKLKSGTINGTKGFTGLHTNKAGNTFIISMLINNFNGTGTQAVNAMYNVLDVLK